MFLGLGFLNIIFCVINIIIFIIIQSINIKNIIIHLINISIFIRINNIRIKNIIIFIIINSIIICEDPVLLDLVEDPFHLGAR